jgi:hypothetical protein
VAAAAKRTTSIRSHSKKQFKMSQATPRKFSEKIAILVCLYIHQVFLILIFCSLEDRFGEGIFRKIKHDTLFFTLNC